MRELLGLLLTGIGIRYLEASQSKMKSYFQISTAAFVAMNAEDCVNGLYFSYQMAMNSILYIYNLTVSAPFHQLYDDGKFFSEVRIEKFRTEREQSCYKAAFLAKWL